MGIRWILYPAHLPCISNQVPYCRGAFPQHCVLFARLPGIQLSSRMMRTTAFTRRVPIERAVSSSFGENAGDIFSKGEKSGWKRMTMQAPFSYTMLCMYLDLLFSFSSLFLLLFLLLLLCSSLWFATAFLSYCGVAAHPGYLFSSRFPGLLLYTKLGIPGK